MRSFIVTLALVATAAAADMPSFPLLNSAVSGLRYPAVGLGTGGYGTLANRKYPECWVELVPGCGAHAIAAVKNWLQLGGTRVDSANSYFNQDSVAKGIKESGVSREKIFITSKIGPSNPLGFNDTLSQMEEIKKKLGVDYVDLLLIHWPTPDAQPASKDPSCVKDDPQYNLTTCRLNTWRAMQIIYQRGDAKAVGVSNYNTTHLQEIIDAGMPLPALNQCPFNPHRSTTQKDTRDFCAKHNILFNGYSPLGIPDLTGDYPKGSSLLLHKYPPPMTANLLDEPLINKIAKAHNCSAAQVVLSWQFSEGVPTNPRSMDPAHMKENMAIFDIELTAEEIQQLGTMPQNYCKDDQWYECAP